ncbi:ABC transporter ATP-binding protein [Lysinibacillus xylanilyticus]|uniref:ABC transporter ATP-binding protein n=1 Tax=Lysinibacillus xylanilyticus TaxID=582475 RepID=UPI003D05C48A
MANVIEVENLVRDYQTYRGVIKKEKSRTRAVDDISFTVKKGEIFGLLGPNGSGKTTTIKVLTTLLSPTLGNVRVLGHRPFGDEKRLRPYINFIYGGERNLYWRITARENLEYFSDLYKVDKKTRNERIPELLDIVGLSERADDRVETFSKGMKQRLQIARGLVNNPDILFLDEPTIGLDPVGARDLRNIIRNLSDMGKTILITTHYMYEADELCDRIAILNKGKIVALDTPENLKKVSNQFTVIELKVQDPTTSEDITNLKGLSGVQTIMTSQEQTHQLIQIQCSEPSKVIASIIRILDNHQIINITTRESSLEDVYLHYVGGQND